MIKPDAARILKDAILPGTARLEGTIDDDCDISWLPHQYKATVNGALSADQFEAIAKWMRSEYEPRDP